MISKLQKWNTLRNQILVVFLIVMAIVLLIVSILTFKQVSNMLKNNGEKQIQQTAIEANGRLESLYEQINTASKLVMTNDAIQEILTNNYIGRKVTFADLQKAKGNVNTLQANTEGIFSFELFTPQLNRLLPFDDTSLTTRIDKQWIEQANEAKGRLVWIGEDPSNSDYVLALRRVNLMNHGFANGGYLLVRIYHNYFQFANQDNNTNQYSMLLDKDLKPILSNYKSPLKPIINNAGAYISLHHKDYMVTKQSSKDTGWTVIILTPVKALTNGLSMLRMGIIISGIIGFFIFFISSFFLSTIITRPIIKLTKTMQKASEGSLTLNPYVPTVNEIKELNSTYNQLVKETNHLIKMVYQKEIIRSQSELKALQAQINPHFLFNTLDALRWSLDDKEEEELAELVIAMSNLFRYTITKQADSDWVPINEEVKHIQDYMEIMKMRFGDQLNWNLNLSSELEHVKIPKLLIQPLVENAVLHGAGNTVHPCTVTVAIQPSMDNGYLEILVNDDGPGMDQEKLNYVRQSMQAGGGTSVKGNGMAIANVYKRLQLFYHERLKRGLTITSEVNMGTTISFEIPMNSEENSHV
ncbi:sensor histidine kinase [Neobacillus drentensis]|uniref:sensor histidine kinase n=1 Tax=Neobacillus drentensis TaxID=220684 RepID=UPI002FFECFBE